MLNTIFTLKSLFQNTLALLILLKVYSLSKRLLMIISLAYSLPGCKELETVDLENGRTLVAVKLELTYEFGHLWIKFKKYDIIRKEFIQKTHVFYVCPVLINHIPCSKIMRNDYPTVRFHACRLKKTTLLHFQHKTIEHSLTAIEEHIMRESQQLQMQRCLQGGTDPDDELLNAVVDVVAKCNMSFHSFTSPEFRHFLEVIVSRVIPKDVGLPPSLFSSLHYKNLVNIILLVAKRRQADLITKLQSATVTLMMDGGSVANTKITALTLLIHEQKSPAFFWRFEPHCSTEAEYRELADHLIAELRDQKIYVVSICTDGLSSQKNAMSSLSPQPGFMTRPFHIYCANHLLNLVIEHSCHSNNLLNSVSKALNEISTNSRVYSMRTLIGRNCPAWVETRWYTLQNIIEFVLQNEVPLLQNGIIVPQDIATIQRFNILFSPLFELHALFENGSARLSDVFPSAMNTVRDLYALSDTGIFQNRWRYAIRSIIFYFIHYFFEGMQGTLFRLAYVLHPMGADRFHSTLFKFQQSTSLPIPLLNLKDEDNTSRMKRTYTPSELAKQFRIKQSSTYPQAAAAPATASINDEVTDSLAQPSTQSGSTSNLQSTADSSFSPFSDTYHETITSTSSSVATYTAPQKQLSSYSSPELSSLLTIPHASLLLEKLIKSCTQEEQDKEEPPDEQPHSLNPSLPILNERLIALLHQLQECESTLIQQDSIPNASSEQTNDDGQPDDPFTLLEQTLQESSYSFIIPHNSQQIESTQQSQSHPYGTRTQAMLHEDVQIIRVRPPPCTIIEPVPATRTSSSSSSSSSMSSCPEEVDPNPQRTVKNPPPYVDDEMEKLYLNQLKTFIEEGWMELLINSFHCYLNTCLEAVHPEIIERLMQCFIQHLSPPLRIQLLNPSKYYWHLSTIGDIENLFSIFSLNLIRSACSEASCERVFSCAKRVVGDQRHSLHLSTLSVLVHAALYEQN